jgi:hypothetical protein
MFGIAKLYNHHAETTRKGFFGFSYSEWRWQHSPRSYRAGNILCIKLKCNGAAVTFKTCYAQGHTNDIVTYQSIARQQLGKHLPLVLYGNNVESTVVGKVLVLC